MADELGYLLLALALVGASFSLLVLRADPTRWDNRIFAAMIFIDAMMEATRGAHLLDGQPITNEAVQLWCMSGSIAISYLTIEFVYSFPFNRRLPAIQRWALLIGSAAAAFLAFHPSTTRWFRSHSYLYFVPIFVVTIYHLLQNYRRLSGRAHAGIPWIMLAVAVRWTSSLFVWMIARRISPEAFSIGLTLDAGVTVIICYALCCRAILRYQLFRVRGVLADAIVYGGLILAIIAALYAAIEIALESGSGPVHLRATLVGMALVPLAISSVARWALPAIEESILCPLFPRRALNKTALAKLVHETSNTFDPPEILTRARSAMEAITGGAKIKFLKGPALPARAQAEDTGGDHKVEIAPELTDHLLRMREHHLDRRHTHDLMPSAKEALERTPGDLFVPVRHEDRLFGAFAIDGGDPDRESVQSAVALADHVALKLENYALFGETLALQGQLEEARRLAALGSFAAAIAHDIRTPLTSVQMNVQILRGKAKLDPDDMEYFDIALGELKRLNAHISELLDYAKPVQMKPAPIDVRDIIDDAAKGIEPILIDRRLHLERHLSGSLPHVYADATRIRQVLLNLLDNAAQASRDGSSIRLSTRAIDESKVALEISDSGKGIEAENLGKIFEPFFTTRPDGTGLGLAIAQKLVRAHGGEIRVQSTVGSGSTFTVLLPAAEGARVG
jgi:signal transduction histidine kinase